MIGINPTDLARIINDVKDSVDRSAFGPLFSYQDNDPTKKQINQIAWSVFSLTLPVVISRSMEATNLAEGIDLEES